MRTISGKTLVSYFFLLVVSACSNETRHEALAYDSGNAVISTSARNPISVRLSQIILPKFEVNNVDIKSAVTELIAAARKEGLKDGNISQVVIAGDPSAYPLITASLQNVSVIDALNNITTDKYIYYRLFDNSIMLYRYEGLIWIKYTLPRGLIQIQESASGAIHCENILKKMGIIFLPGCSAVVYPKSQELVLISVPDQISIFDSIIQNYLETQLRTVPQ